MADDTLKLERSSRLFNKASGFFAVTPPPAVFNTTGKVFTRRGFNKTNGSDILPYAPPAIISGTLKDIGRRGFSKASTFLAFPPPPAVFNTAGIPAPRVALPVLSDTDDAKILTRGGAFDLDFEADDTRGLPPHTVQFTNKSQTPIDIWTWEFGDGFTSNEENPTHTYLEQGLWTVTLRSGSPIYGYARITKTDYIDTRVLLTINPQSGKAPLKVSFNIDERQL